MKTLFCWLNAGAKTFHCLYFHPCSHTLTQCYCVSLFHSQLSLSFSVPFCPSFSVSLSLCLSFTVPFCLSFSVTLPLFLYLFLFVFLCLYLYFKRCAKTLHCLYFPSYNHQLSQCYCISPFPLFFLFVSSIVFEYSLPFFAPSFLSFNL